MKTEDDNSRSVDVEAASKFLEEANEDILFEIFVRLPNCRAAVWLGSLSRRLYSVISQPTFVPHFISHHHKDRCPPPYTIIFCEAERLHFDGPQQFQPLCSLFSPGSISLHGGKIPAASSYLGFLPVPEVVMRASCDDLLLVSPGPRFSNQDLYICNPITKQHRRVPPCPLEFRVAGHALLINNRRLDVLLLSQPKFHRQTVEQSAAVYRSGSGRWEFVPFHYPRGRRLHKRNCSVDLMVRDGVVYYLEYVCWVTARRVVYFDMARGEGGVIDRPSDFFWFRMLDVIVVGGNLVDMTEARTVRMRIGVVEGGSGLRLVQAVVLLSRKKRVYLRVWELLGGDEPSWVLVHSREYIGWPAEGELVGVYVHPTDGDSVFVVWGKSVFQYDLSVVGRKRKHAWEFVGELRETLELKDLGRAMYDHRLTSFPVLHPVWPTPIPSL